MRDAVVTCRMSVTRSLKKSHRSISIIIFEEQLASPSAINFLLQPRIATMPPSQAFQLVGTTNNLSFTTAAFFMVFIPDTTTVAPPLAIGESENEVSDHRKFALPTLRPE